MPKKESKSSPAAVGSDEGRSYDKKTLLKDNRLIEGLYKARPYEDKIVYLAMLNVQEGNYVVTDKGLVEIRIRVRDLADYIGWKNHRGMYTDLKEVAMGLSTRVVLIEDEEGDFFKYVSIIPEITYSSGELYIYFNDLIIQYLVDIKKNFTMLPSSVVKRLHRTYSFPLYQIFKKEMFYSRDYRGDKDAPFLYETGVSKLKIDIGIVDVSSSKIRRMMKKKPTEDADYDEIVKADSEAKFKMWGDFDRYCLKKCVDEINEVSDIRVSYEPVRMGRGGGVKRVRFFLSFKDVLPKDEEPSGIQRAAKDASRDKWEIFLMTVGSQAQSLGLGVKELEVLGRDCGYDSDRLTKVMKVYESQGSETRSVMGFLRVGLREGYELNDAMPASEQTPSSQGTQKKSQASPDGGKKTKFSNFKEHGYDYEQVQSNLISQLLGG